jgi:hypothetical protein
MVRKEYEICVAIAVNFVSIAALCYFLATLFSSMMLFQRFVLILLVMQNAMWVPIFACLPKRQLARM